MLSSSLPSFFYALSSRSFAPISAPFLALSARAHFEKLAHSHVEARFVKIDAEKNPFLVAELFVFL
jgi:hypothetical protein